MVQSEPQLPVGLRVDRRIRVRDKQADMAPSDGRSARALPVEFIDRTNETHVRQNHRCVLGTRRNEHGFERDRIVAELLLCRRKLLAAASVF